MNLRVLPHAVLVPLCVLVLCLPCRAASSADSTLDETALAQLEARAQQANPREQCFLYTELVQQMTAIAGKQLLAGDSDRASATLKRVERYANLIHMSLARDTRRLKEAEMGMHTASRRLGEFLHLVSPEDKVVLEATLKQLDKVNEELLTQVFAH
ncbi:hypothetical protein SAMN05421770_102531 [Granulicella rosea]|uniref:Uncharacterized protein n=1 Tax=Granulicella rosea TaxID=474952 RepID=A0A239HV30_9BACT|nr:hypothetical protein [Granulicella rosea]SNS84034.1 hypothetical protein SAMN05421770_102531 [Granulicella rosea]